MVFKRKAKNWLQINEAYRFNYNAKRSFGEIFAKSSEFDVQSGEPAVQSSVLFNVNYGALRSSEVRAA